MFNGYKIVDNNYLYLYLDNNYEFASDLVENETKKINVIHECNNFLNIHNLKFNNKLFLISKGIVIGYITNETLNRYK